MSCYQIETDIATRRLGQEWTDNSFYHDIGLNEMIRDDSDAREDCGEADSQAGAMQDPPASVPRHSPSRIASAVHRWELVPRPFDFPNAISYWWSFETKPLSLTVFKIPSIKCSAMVDMTLIRPLNKGQGHSFWYQSISHIRLPIGCQY